MLNGFGKSLEVILPKLRDGYIVPDSGLGRNLALENPDAFFLSAQSGECFHNVTVTGGKQRAEGPLSMKRELRDVLRLLTDLEDALRTEEHRVLTLSREITELTSLLERLEREKRDAEKEAMTSGHMLQQLDAEMSRVNERLGIASQELASKVAEARSLPWRATERNWNSRPPPVRRRWRRYASDAIWPPRMPRNISRKWPPSRSVTALRRQFCSVLRVWWRRWRSVSKA